MTLLPALVTGGCGFVGRHVVARLIADGRDIWIVDDLSTGQAPDRWLPALGLEPVAGQPGAFIGRGVTVTAVLDDVRHVFRTSQSGERTLPQFGDVVHLAAVVGGRVKIDGDPLSVATDLAIDAEFFAWAVRARPGRILFASSSAAYPVRLQGAGDGIALREDAIDFEGGDLGMPDMTYGWSKLTGEYLARIAAKKYGLHVACVRPFSGYGEDQDETYPVPAIAARAARHENPLTIWGSGQQGRDFVHIDDCVDAMFAALAAISDGGAVNIGSGKLTTFHDVARLFADLAGYQPEIVALADKPVGVQVRYADTTKMRTQLGWSPRISLVDGFRRVIEAAERRTRQPVEAGT